MARVKVYRVTGEFMMGRLMTRFSKDIKAVKESDALDRVYKEIGSRHKVKRRMIQITRVEELTEEGEEVE